MSLPIFGLVFWPHLVLFLFGGSVPILFDLLEDLAISVSLTAALYLVLPRLAPAYVMALRLPPRPRLTQAAQVGALAGLIAAPAWLGIFSLSLAGAALLTAAVVVALILGVWLLLVHYLFS